MTDYKQGLYVGWQRGLLCGAVCSAVLVALLCYLGPLPQARMDAVHAAQKDAVKAKAGKWTPGDDGEPVFVWSACR